MRHSLAVDPFEVEVKNAPTGEGVRPESVTCGRARDVTCAGADLRCWASPRRAGL